MSISASKDTRSCNRLLLKSLEDIDAKGFTPPMPEHGIAGLTHRWIIVAGSLRHESQSVKATSAQANLLVRYPRELETFSAEEVL